MDSPRPEPFEMDGHRDVFDADELHTYLTAKAESYGLALDARDAIESVLDELYPELAPHLNRA